LFVDTNNNTNSLIIPNDFSCSNQLKSSNHSSSIEFSHHHSTAIRSTSMQNTTSSLNLGAIGTGIVPPPMHAQQTQYMQSTTPSVANGKDEMRGWLYKWTNVKNNNRKIASFVSNFHFFSSSSFST